MEILHSRNWNFEKKKKKTISSNCREISNYRNWNFEIFWQKKPRQIEGNLKFAKSKS